MAKKGGDETWQVRKKSAMRLAAGFGGAGDVAMFNKIYDCCESLQFAYCPDHGGQKLIHASFCRQRLCPVCEWRRARVLRAQMGAVLAALRLEAPKTRFGFLTLTVPNVPVEKLSGKIAQMLDALKQFWRDKTVALAVTGWYRSLETTYNPVRGDFHPHLHILLQFSPEYYSKIYVKQEFWLELWRRKMNDDTITQVHIKSVKNRDGDDMWGTVLELSKYAISPLDIFDDRLSLDILCHEIPRLYTALKGKRLVGYGGELRKIRKGLNLVDESELTNEDLIGADSGGCNCNVCGMKMLKKTHTWDWQKSSYGI